jgi:hypothetical protein
MKQLYSDIKTKLQEVSGFNYIGIWNNQVEAIQNRDPDDYSANTWPLPALFVEIVTSSDNIQQLGNGVQIYDPLPVRIHIVDDFYNGDNMEENTRVFDHGQAVYAVLQKFEPDGAVAFIRTGEEQDFDHNNVYHFIQTYTTNYIDSSREEPVGFLEKEPPTDLEITGEYEN